MSRYIKREKMSALNFVKGIDVRRLPLELRQQVRKAADRGHSKEFVRLLVRHLRYGFGLSLAFKKTREKVPV